MPEGVAWIGPLAYFLVQIGYYGVRMGRKTYVVDLADSDTRATYVAVANTLMGVLLLVGGGVGSVLSRFGDLTVMGVFSGVALAGAAGCLRLRNVEA